MAYPSDLVCRKFSHLGDERFLACAKVQKIVFDKIIHNGVELPPGFDEIGFMLDDIAQDWRVMPQYHDLLRKLRDADEGGMYENVDDQIIHTFQISIENLFGLVDNKFATHPNSFAIEGSLRVLGWCINAMSVTSIKDLDVTNMPEGLQMVANMAHDAFTALAGE